MRNTAEKLKLNELITTCEQRPTRDLTIHIEMISFSEIDHIISKTNVRYCKADVIEGIFSDHKLLTLIYNMPLVGCKRVKPT